MGRREYEKHRNKVGYISSLAAGRETKTSEGSQRAPGRMAESFYEEEPSLEGKQLLHGVEMNHRVQPA